MITKAQVMRSSSKPFKFDSARSIFKYFPHLCTCLAEIVLRMSHDNEVRACSSIVLRIKPKRNLAEMKVDHPNKRAVVMAHKF